MRACIVLSADCIILGLTNRISQPGVSERSSVWDLFTQPSVMRKQRSVCICIENDNIIRVWIVLKSRDNIIVKPLQSA